MVNESSFMSASILPTKLLHNNIIDKEGNFIPLHLQIYPTNKCNLNCVGCWLYSPYLKGVDRVNLEEQLDLDIIKDAVDELHKGGVEEIQISGGGEPLIHPDFLKIVKYIKVKKII